MRPAVEEDEELAARPDVDARSPEPFATARSEDAPADDPEEKIDGVDPDGEHRAATPPRVPSPASLEVGIVPPEPDIEAKPGVRAERAGEERGSELPSRAARSPLENGNDVGEPPQALDLGVGQRDRLLDEEEPFRTRESLGLRDVEERWAAHGRHLRIGLRDPIERAVGAPPTTLERSAARSRSGSNTASIANPAERKASAWRKPETPAPTMSARRGVAIAHSMAKWSAARNERDLTRADTPAIQAFSRAIAASGSKRYRRRA